MMDYTTLTYKKYKDIHNNILYFDNDTDRTTEIISIVYDLEFDDVENMTITEYRKLAQSCEFLKHPIDNKLKKIYDTLIINGIDYTLFTDIENMKVSQYIDFSNYIKNADEKIPEILSCFLIPEGHTYNDGYDIKKTINDINEYLSVQEVMQLSAFFLLLSQSLIKGLIKTKIGKLKRLMRTEKNKTIREEMKRRIKVMESQLSIGLP